MSFALACPIWIWGERVSETRSFLESLVAHVDDETGNMVFVSFGEGLKPQVWSMPPGRVSEMGPKLCGDWNAELGRNVYWSAGLRRRDLSPAQRGGAADVTAMLAIVVDLDDEDAARGWEAKVAALPGLRPSAVVRTSFTPTPRFQLVYLLNEPTSDFEHWRRAARCVEAYFGADHCSKDLAHVWRVPGTMNFPNSRKQAQGRVAETTALVHFDAGRRFELSDFTDNLNEPEPEVEVPNVLGAAVDLERSWSWETYNEVVGCLPEWLQLAIITGDSGQTDRSTFDWQIAKECARAGLKLGDLLDLYRLGAHEKFAAKWREKEMNRPGSGNEYLARTYIKARNVAEKEGPLPEKADTYWLNFLHGGDDAIPADAVEVGEEAGAAATVGFDWIDAVKSCKDVRDLPEEPTEFLIFPWLQKGAIHCIHGPSGAGKSYFLAHQLFGLARGRGVGPFTVGKPEKVLYIDCEMGGRTIRNRMRSLERAYGYDNEERFLVWSPFFAPRNHMPYVDLFDQEVWQRIGLMVKRLDPEVIVIDNARACTDDLIENDAEGWKKLNRFWLWLREGIDRERTVVWVHHDNKAKEGRTYAGSTAAITVTEVVVPITQLKKQKVLEIGEDVKRRTGGAYTVRHAIEVDMQDSKIREKDPAIHDKWTLMYRVCLEDGVTKMHEWSDRAGEPGDMTGLSKQEQAWYLTRMLKPKPLSYRDAVPMFDPPVSHVTLKRWADQIDGQAAAIDKIRQWAEGKAD
jgi:hypothetical protein